jgi:LAO/AO transport system kinase
MPRRLSLDQYKTGVLAGNRIILSQAITLLESKLPEDVTLANQLLEELLPRSGGSIRIGITGVPGVGKSTIIEALGQLITRRHQLAVLAIDPTSQVSKGSILGDKTRMESLAKNRNAYIRPSVTGTALGGVAFKTRETIILLEAAGFDYILVETVGVGQSETLVHDMVDFFVLLMLAGAGDELQGIKRGIMEMADALIITKADGENLNKARKAQAEFKSALHLFPPKESNWVPPVILTSATAKTGLDDLLDTIEKYRQHTQTSGYFEQNRNRQNIRWLYDYINSELKGVFYGSPKIKLKLAKLEKAIVNGQITPSFAANNLLDIWKNQA